MPILFVESISSNEKIIYYIRIVPYIIDKVVHSLKTNMEL